MSFVRKTNYLTWNCKKYVANSGFSGYPNKRNINFPKIKVYVHPGYKFYLCAKFQIYPFSRFCLTE